MAETARDKPMSDIGFRVMSFFFKIRDIFVSPEKELKKHIEPGQHVLDYGCGPGSYTIAAARLVGNSGKVYAADIHPLAISKVSRTAAKRQLTNVETILTDCATGLGSNTIDIVLCLDIFHGLSDPASILTEMHRVLKSDGILILDYHHMKEEALLNIVDSTGLFKVKEKVGIKYLFTKL